MHLPGSALEGGAVFEGEGQATIRVGRGVVQQAAWHGRILTLDGLRVICAGLDNDPEKISIHMLEMLAKFRNEGIEE
ncbi:MAG: hypothetical protein J6A79_07305 [Clostridia bacterium]|nr:hypothetical protein [Clostridia bacterium]